MVTVAIVLILAVAALCGHVLVILFFYNRIYGMVRIRGEKPWLNAAASLATAVPWVMFVVRHGWPHHLLTGQLGWHDLDLRMQVYLGACWAMFFLVVPLERLCRRWRGVPRAQLSNHSCVVDLSGKLARGGRGPRAPWWMSRVPGNQILQIEIVEKQLALAHVPPALAGLSIVHLTDLHVAGIFSPEFYHQVFGLVNHEKPDVVVLTGDLLDHTRYMHASLGHLAELRPRLGTFAIRGNHDSWAGAEGLARLLEHTGVHLLDNRCRMLDVSGAALAIIGLEYPFLGRPNDLDLSVIPDGAFRLLLSHSPDNIDWASEHGVDLMLCGHTHGGQIRFPVFGGICMPSQHGCRYDAGLFEDGPTLMYVSRGLAGDVPLRLGCRPEITKFVLHPAAALPLSPAAMSVATR